MSKPAPRGDNVWWIDDKGRWLNFGEEYASRFPECYFQQTDHRHGPAFDMFGMVKVTSYTRLVDIHWDVRRVAPGSLSATLDHLLSLESSGNNGTMVALKFFFGAWNSELYQSPGSALERIVELSEHASSVPSDAITIASVDLREIDRSHSLICSCFTRWRAMEGVLGGDSSFDLGDVKERSLLLGHDSLRERLVYKSVGPQSLASHLLGDDWHYAVLGQPIENCYSDDDYEMEVCSDYPDVMESSEPRLDHIRAYYHLNGDDPIWLNYERLLLPWKTRAGEPMVMCFSQQSQDLTVTFLEAAIDLAA